MKTYTSRLFVVLCAGLLLLTACTADGDDVFATADDEAFAFDDEGFDDEGFDDEGFDDEGFDDEGFDDEDFDDEDFDEEFDGDEEQQDMAQAEADGESTPDGSGAATVDLTLERGDIDCTGDGLGSDDTTMFTVAHVVVDGKLGAVCFGDQDPRLVSAWESLAVITPAGQLRDLGLFGGFRGPGDGDETTLAFVNALDDAGSLFQMSINVDEADVDPAELLLTLAHEFSHVFTATSAQLDRESPAEDCETFDNGEGCYLKGSVMAEWVRLFWGNGLIEQIDVSQDASVGGGEQRCAANPGFFGPYAASSPEEDFAETFSAYVFRVAADTAAQQAKIDWIADQPGLVEFQDRAVAAALGPLNNNFESCG